MSSSSDLEAALAAESRPEQRVLLFAAFLRREAGLGVDDIIVVGGSAIEIYTKGAYVSGDIDICAPRTPVANVLKRWGFTQPGREWARLDWQIVVDVVGPYPSGSMLHTRLVEAPHGPVRVGAIEDLILGRLALVKFWNESREVRNLLLLLALPGLDWKYLDRMAKQNQVEDLLARVRTPDSAPEGESSARS